MPTTVNSDIGGGANDYADPFLWELATDNDLVSADQLQVGRLYGEHTGNLLMDGATTDSTRYRILQAASGEGIGTSDPYTYDGSLGAAITSASTYTTAACQISENNSRVVGVQVRVTSNSNQPLRTDNANRFERCLAQGASTTRSVAQSTTVAGAVFEACTIINRGSGSAGACVALYFGGTIQNCTIVTPSDLTDPTDGIFISFPDSSAIIRNNVVCGFTNVGSTTGGSNTLGTPATCTNNFTDSASPPSGFSAITYTTSTGAGNAGFENITDGTHDFRIKTASALVGAGTATGAPATDMAGRSYAGTPSVGAHEGAAGAAPTITVHPVGSAAAVGATTQFSITSGDATSYQWQVSTNGGETWASVSGGSGGTTATYTTPTTVAGDNGRKYRCVATNANGSTNSGDAFFHVSGVGLTGRGRGTSRERYPPLIDPQLLVRIDPRVCPQSGPACFDDVATAFKDLYFYSDPVPPAVPNEVEHWTWSTRNRPGSGPLSTGKFFIAQPRMWAPAASVNATFDGQLLTNTVSLAVAGTLSNDSTFAGQLLTNTITLSVVGTLRADATIAGQLLTNTLSISAAGIFTSDSNFAGVLQQNTISLIPGTLSNDSSIAGQTLTNTVSLAATGTLTTAQPFDGQLLTNTVSLIAGALSNDSTFAGVTITNTINLLAGSISGGSSATIDGQLLENTVSLLAGALSADATIAGQTLTNTVSLSAAGTLRADASFGAQLLVNTVSLLTGAFTNDSTFAGQVLVNTITLTSGALDAPPAGGALKQVRPLGVDVSMRV